MTGGLSQQARVMAHVEADWRGKSTSELLHHIGKMVEDRPGVLQVQHGPKHNTDARPWEGLSIDRPVNMDCANRLSAFAQEQRERMGEERWRQLNAEWEA